MDLHDRVSRMGREVSRLMDLVGSAQEGLARCLEHLQGEEGERSPAREDGGPWVAYA